MTDAHKKWDVWLDLSFYRSTTIMTPRLLEALSDKDPVFATEGDVVSIGVTVGSVDPAGAVRAAVKAIRDAFDTARVHGDWGIDRAEAIDPERAEAELDRATYPSLLGVTELAALLDVSRQRVHELREAGRLPSPLTVLAAGPIWPKPTIEKFLESWDRRPGRRSAQS